jgi:FkbM family methyltransferase
MNPLRRVRALSRLLGVRQTLSWTWQARALRRPAIEVAVPGESGSSVLPSRRVWARPGTSDLQVFSQIFVEREYAPFDDLRGVGTILDCGANVGYSSVYFLDRFPKARLLAIEPDEMNFEVLSRNLAPFGDRALAVRGGVWNACGRLHVSEGVYRDGGKWSVQVRLARGDESGSFPSFDLPALMNRAGFDRVSLLKIDVEGAEALVFDSTSSAWLDRVDNIAIELHDDSSFGMASPVFWRAVLDRGFEFSRSGELTLCRRPIVRSA